MSGELPKFQPRNATAVRGFITRALTKGDSDTLLRDLIAYKDGHFRAVFDKRYFVLGEDVTEPSKSQWNTLKKHLKRMDPKIFIFKEHGTVACGEDECYYVDFGFFSY
jgi:hypothetical protein